MVKSDFFFPLIYVSVKKYTDRGFQLWKKTSKKRDGIKKNV